MKIVCANNNFTNNIENWYRKLVKEVIINIFYLKLQILPDTRQDSGELIFQQDCHSAQEAIVFWHKYSVAQKEWHNYCTPLLYQILTDFQNYFTFRMRR